MRKKRVRGWCGVGMRVAGAQELMQLDVAVAGGGGGDIGFDSVFRTV